MIIDEASQQDIVPGILGLGCARNVIVVGDRKQLPHVPVLLPNSPSPPAEYYNCEKYSLLDSVCMLFRNMVPVTLLKEHYRCHPKIIQFCNKQFYDNALIPLTVDSGEASLSLVITAKETIPVIFQISGSLNLWKVITGMKKVAGDTLPHIMHRLIWLKKCCLLIL